MQNGGRVVPGVLAVEKRFGDAGLAQIAVHVAAAYAFIDGTGKVTARDVHVLSDIGEDDGEAGVLADRHFGSVSDGSIVEELLQDVFSNRGRLAFKMLSEAFDHIAGQVAAGLNGELRHRVRDILAGYFTHCFLHFFPGVRRGVLRGRRGRHRGLSPPPCSYFMESASCFTYGATRAW